MAVFRAITSEEEAARAVLESLKRHGYTGAEHLNWRRHEHKAAVAPFFDVVLRFAAQIPGLETHLKWNTEEVDSPLELGFRFPAFPNDIWMYPLPPLNFSLSADDKIHDFAPEIEVIASNHNVRSIQKLIEQRANQRNEVLYAGDRGIPNVVGPIEGFLHSRRDEVFRMLGVYLLIDPYNEHQLLVQQALNAFLRILPRLKLQASS